MNSRTVWKSKVTKGLYCTWQASFGMNYFCFCELNHQESCEVSLGIANSTPYFLCFSFFFFPFPPSYIFLPPPFSTLPIPFLPLVAPTDSSSLIHLSFSAALLLPLSPLLFPCFSSSYLALFKLLQSPTITGWNYPMQTILLWSLATPAMAIQCSVHKNQLDSFLMLQTFLGGGGVKPTLDTINILRFFCKKNVKITPPFLYIGPVCGFFDPYWRVKFRQERLKVYICSSGLEPNK